MRIYNEIHNLLYLPLGRHQRLAAQTILQVYQKFLHFTALQTMCKCMATLSDKHCDITVR